MLKYLGCAAGLMLLPLLSLGQDISLDVVGDGVKQVTVVSKFPVTVKAPIDGFFDWDAPADVIGVDKGRTFEITSAPKGMRLIRVRVRYAKIENGQIEYVTKFGEIPLYFGEPVPGPTPEPPGPKPPEPKPPTPQPVKSYRVIFVYESADTLTKEQNSAMYAKEVRDYLKKSTTPENGTYGYRYWDQNETAEKESSTMRALWGAIKPKLTTVPVVAIEVNGVVDLLPLPATPAETVTLLKKYKGE